MKQSAQGSAPVRTAILALAQELQATFPHALYALVGIALTSQRSTPSVGFDLLLITEAALFVGIDIQQSVTTPRSAAQQLAEWLERAKLLTRPLPVYAFWLGEATSQGRSDDTPILTDTRTIQRYLLSVPTHTLYPTEEITALASALLQQDVGLSKRKRSPISHLRHALEDMVELPAQVDAALQEQIRRPYFFRRNKPILPADINRHLEKTMLARENLLEDADYTRVVPNDFLVQLNPENYDKRYRPIEQQICERWQTNLLENLQTTNERQGRQEYKFAGRVQVRIEPSIGLAQGDVSIISRINPSAGEDANLSSACLELMAENRHWRVKGNMVTIGRQRTCNIYLDMLTVQEKRLISGYHAYLAYESGQYRLYDGAPGGIPSTNGTFVNGQRVTQKGQQIYDGDLIILASLDVKHPRPDTPGVAALRFHADCPFIGNNH